MIDILLATYNGDKFLEEQLESIRVQSYNDWRILVKDDGSTDDTINIIKKWKGILGEKLIILNDDIVGLGASKNFNFLLEKSNSSYIMLSDQDDVWLKDKILKSFNVLKKLENHYGSNTPLMVCCDLEVVDEKLNLISSSFWNMRRDDPSILEDHRKLIAHSVVTGNTILMNKSAVLLSIPVKTSFFLHDQWISIKVAYYGKIEFIPESLIKYRQHTSNVLGSFQLGYKYLLNKIRFVPYYLISWKNLKKELGIDFSVVYVLLFKLIYNLKKLQK